MKKGSILIASFLISIQLVAQESELKANLNTTSQFDSINLNTYKQANYKQATMGVGFGLNGGGNVNSSYSDYSQYNTNTSGLFSYTKTKNSRNYIGSQGLVFTYRVGYNNFNSEFSPSSTSWSNFYLSATTNNRFYLSNNFFYDLNLDVTNTASYYHTKFELEPYDSTKTRNQFETSNQGSIQFGKGRIENVTDAQLAIYILDDLLKHGRLARVPNESEVFEFADFITKTLNKRVIDDRLKQIMEYVAVDSFLVAKGLVTKSDGLCFGLISDNWRYARLENWLTGHTWSFGISPTLTYGNLQYKSTENNIISLDQRDEFSNYGIGASVSYNSYWIKGIKRKDGFNLNGTFNILWKKNIPNDVENYQALTTTVGYYRSYIPNSRTSITGSTYLQINKKFNDYNVDDLEIKPAISGSCNYYFSEKVRLSVSSFLYYRFSKEYDFNVDTKQLQFNLGASLSYYIF